jgi:DNA mismatch repair protein MutS2
MDEKTLYILEFDKILERLAGYCAFAASAEKARALRPTDDLIEARRRLAVTSEAVDLLATRPEMTIGGARDVREAVDLAQHGGVLEPGLLLDVKYTMIAARNLGRTFERLVDQFPNLADLAAQLPPSMGIIDSISQAISDRGDILDSASDRLANIRRDLRIVHDRLLSKLQRMVTDSRYATYLQEPIVTQRDGRYVLPLRAEFKGRIRSIVHDQSASGATLFVEPLTVVEQNNQYRELLLEERDEERRILVSLSSMVGMHAPEIYQAVDVVAELDLALARARYAGDLNATAPVLREIDRKPGKREWKAEKARRQNEPGGAGPEQKEMRHPGSMIRIYQARHPLLDPQSVVPIDVELDAGTFVLVITGPNTGGKTVTLKTVGLLALMSQSGLHIPAHSGSEITLFKDIFADIGDEQSIEQSLSTFSSHITNIIRILEQADEECLVILDELGAGTDPQEGAALARALLDHLVGRSITTLVTTHHPELKAYAHSTPGVVNASVQFDLETLRPTFHLVIGLPGRSNALAIAQRLGMPDGIVAAARSELNPEDLRAEDLLDEIHRQRDLAQESRAVADKIRQESEKLRQELCERLDQIEDERQEILYRARDEADSLIADLKGEIEDLRRTLRKARQPAEALEAIEDRYDELEATVEQPVERKQPVVSPAIQEFGARQRRSIQLGDKVRLRTLNTTGVVTTLSEDDAELQVGMLRVRARLGELELISGTGDELGEEGSSPDKSLSTHRGEPPPKISQAESPGIELDIRGNRADDALVALERYLDAAYIARLPFVRIIHGKGTGKLRDVVRQALKGHPHVKTYEAGGEKEGGDGVTVAKLVS